MTPTPPEPESFEPHSAPGAVAWAETVLLALGPPLLGLWLRPDDPFFLGGGFSWPVLGPLLAGLRYGSLHGLSCGLILDVALLLYVRAGHGALPLGAAAGFAICGAICGEFCDAMARRANAASARAAQARARLDEFARTFHALRASHETLERRSLGASSLREALLAVGRFLALEPGHEGLTKAGDRILGLLAEHAAVRAASLHPLDRGGRMLPAIAVLGEVQAAPPDDALAWDALAKGKLAALSEAPAEVRGALLAALPLADVSGTVHALIAIRDLHFLAFNDETLALLAVIGGHLGDLIAASGGAPDEPAPALFERRVRRAIEDAARFGLPSALVSIALQPGGADALAGRILEERRGLDPVLRVSDAEGRPLVFVLLPLADARGAEGYLSRLDRLLGAPLREAGNATVKLISGRERLDELLAPFQPPAGSDALPVALPARR